MMGKQGNPHITATMLTMLFGWESFFASGLQRLNQDSKQEALPQPTGWESYPSKPNPEDDGSLLEACFKLDTARTPF